jgi:hypothetical protein
MTTPDIKADTADNARVDVTGAVRSIKATATVPATTATGKNVGMVRFQKGFSLVSFGLESEDLDTGTDVTLSVGYIYDDDDTYTDDPNAFVDASDIGQDAGSVVWPVADGLLTGSGFEAEAPGYLVIATGGGATTTEGDLTMIVNFTYNQ